MILITAPKTLHCCPTKVKVFGLHVEQEAQRQDKEACNEQQKAKEWDHERFILHKVCILDDPRKSVILRYFIDKEATHGVNALGKGGVYDDCLREDVHIKVVMVANSNTVVNPGTVMVKALDAVSTDRAVSASAGPYRLAIGAELSAIDDIKHFHEVDVLVAYVSRLSHRRESEKE